MCFFFLCRMLEASTAVWHACGSLVVYLVVFMQTKANNSPREEAHTLTSRRYSYLTLHRRAEQKHVVVLAIVVSSPLQKVTEQKMHGLRVTGIFEEHDEALEKV